MQPRCRKDLDCACGEVAADTVFRPCDVHEPFVMICDQCLMSHQLSQELEQHMDKIDARLVRNPLYPIMLCNIVHRVTLPQELRNLRALRHPAYAQEARLSSMEARHSEDTSVAGFGESGI